MLLPLAIASFVLSAGAIAARIHYDVSYGDLKELNASCYPKYTCAERVPEFYAGITFPNGCSCHDQCSTFGTCCVDSPHRGGSPTTHKCGSLNFPQTHFRASGCYMVQSCPENSAWKHLCEGDVSKDGDVLKIAPVSSLDTNTTYRNYYCFRCHEDTDDFLFWDLELLGSYSGPMPATDDFKVTYDDVNDTWSATAVNEDISISVRLQFYIPVGINFLVIDCNPKVISDCPGSWEDDAVRSKCHSYMALVYKSCGPVYRNVHCALCHYESLHGMSCKAPGYPYVQHTFSFSHLIDINRSDKELLDKKCADGEVWDPYAKKCRKLSCALPGNVIKEGKCVAP